MRKRSWIAVSLIAAIACVELPSAALARPVRSRILQGFEVDEGEDDWELRIHFGVPVRYLRHVPHERGRQVQVQLEVLRISAEDALFSRTRESLLVPSNLPVPVAEVTYEGDRPGQPLLVVEFERPLDFEVRQGADLRSIVVSIRRPARAKGRPPRARAPAAPRSAAAPVPEERVAEWMEEGRQAMTKGEIDRAIQIYTKVLSLPENESSRSALELLALARERNGQLAHARAQYEEYLRRYPDGEDAARVRQRLEALVTARAEPAESRREEAPERRRIEFDAYGSLYTGYRRQSIFVDELGEVLADSSLFTDVHVGTRLRSDRYTLRSQMSGGYLYDFLDGEDETRINTLFVDFEHHVHRISGAIGRQRESSRGILGRYDGIGLSYRLGDRFELGAVGGFAVETLAGTRVEFDRSLAGLSVDVDLFDESLHAQLFGINQLVDGSIDRTAVGGELRYFQDGRFVAAFLDYDVYFLSLNVAQLVGNWQITPKTFLNFQADYRNTPTLTRTNAELGQVGSLGDLDGLFTDGEILALARDRTARSTLLSLGASQILGNRLQLAFDFAATDLSGMPASGGVEAIEGTGFEFYYSTQLIASDLLMTGDTGILGLRFFDGSRMDVAGVGLDARYPITRALRVNPRLRADYRLDSAAGDTFSLLPSLRLDYRLWKLVFDTDAGLEWNLPIGGATVDDEWGYYIGVGVRYDF